MCCLKIEGSLVSGICFMGVRSYVFFRSEFSLFRVSDLGGRGVYEAICREF